MTNETQKPKHTPEPWWTNGVEIGTHPMMMTKITNRISGNSYEEATANAQRIVSCVNAMKDISDPQKFMDDVLVRLQNEIEQNAHLSEQLTQAVVRINDLEAECGRSEVIFDVKTSVDVEKLAESQRKLYEKLTGEQNVNDNSKQSHPTRTPNAPKHFLILNTEHNTLYSENNDGYATPYPTYDKAVDVAQQFVNAPFQIIPVNS